MAGDWIKLRTNLHSDPAVKAIARALKLDVDAVVGKLARAWIWFGDNSTDGVMANAIESDLDDEVGFVGFASAMRQVGWLVIDAEKIAIPKWNNHNGQCAKKRAVDNRRKARSRSCPVVERTRSGPEQRTAKSRDTEKEKTSRRSSRVRSHPPPDSPALNPEVAAAQSAIQRDACRMLLNAAVDWGEVLPLETAAKIAEHPNSTIANVAWAIERCSHVRKRGKVANSIGYLRRLVEGASPPRMWMEQYNRRQLGLAAAKDVSAERSRIHSAATARPTLPADGDEPVVIEIALGGTDHASNHPPASPAETPPVLAAAGPMRSKHRERLGSFPISIGRGEGGSDL